MKRSPVDLDVRTYGALPKDIDQLPVESKARPSRVLAAEESNPYLLETEAFIGLFNDLVGRSKLIPWKISKRTLQFYSSPRLRVMPPPIRRAGQGHRGYYLVPNHIWRLMTIQHLKQKYFLPLWLIREILASAAPNDLELGGVMILRNLPTDQFLDALPLIAKVPAGDLQMYYRCQSISGQKAMDSKAAAGLPKSAFQMFQEEVLFSLDVVRDWVLSAEGKKTFFLVESAKDESETKKLLEQVMDFKKKLLRKS